MGQLLKEAFYECGFTVFIFALFCLPGLVSFIARAARGFVCALRRRQSAAIRRRREAMRRRREIMRDRRKYEAALQWVNEHEFR